MSSSLSFKLNYKGSEQVRIMNIADVEIQDGEIPLIRNKVIAINESLAGGTASDLANLFVSDDYDSQENIGTLQKITDVQLRRVVETPIN